MIFNILIYILQLLRVYYEQCDHLPDGLIAQIVQHCTGIAEVMCSNPVQALIFLPGVNFTAA